jgi:hypothetical protein
MVVYIYTCVCIYISNYVLDPMAGDLCLTPMAGAMSQTPMAGDLCLRQSYSYRSVN